MTQPPTDQTPSAKDVQPGDTPASEEPAAQTAPKTVVGLITRHVHYPNAYIWLLLMSALDIMLTYTIFYFGGREVNPIAKKIYDDYNIDGLIIYKFLLILFFITICEIVGTMKEPTGRALSRISVLIACFPVCWSLTLLARYSGLLN